MSLKRHNKICSDVKVPDEDFFDEESKKIADEIEIEEDVPIINIFQMIEKSAFEEIEGKRNVHLLVIVIKVYVMRCLHCRFLLLCIRFPNRSFWLWGVGWGG